MKDDQLMQMLAQPMSEVADDNFSEEVIKKLSKYQTMRSRFIAIAAIACAVMVFFLLPLELITNIANSMGGFYLAQLNLAEYWIPALIIASTFWLLKTEEA